MRAIDYFRKKLVQWLGLNNYQQSYSFNRDYTFRENALKNQIWYSGSASSLRQFYNQTDDYGQTFWGANETAGQEIRRFHSSLPQLIVDMLVKITADDLSAIDFEKEKDEKEWKKIAEENNFNEILQEIVKTALVIGDGAVKFNFNLDIADTPLMEVYSGENVEFIYDTGKIKEIIFYDYINYRSTDYTLEEHYGYGYIKYQLFKGDAEIPLVSIPQTADLESVQFDSKIIFAVPFKITNSTTYKGRGKSVYEGKTGAFDSIDECISQWIDALRMGRTKVYIPDSLIPRNIDGGYLLRPNTFDNRFIQTSSGMKENSVDKIETIQPDIKTDAYLQTYITMLDIVLQGVISPSTLGIDNKKLDNAESQREKEKTTLYTRASIISSLQKIINDLITTSFKINALIHNGTYTEPEFSATFGEYANPSFESVIETIGKAKIQGIMSIETSIEEMYGDTKDEEWKAEEVKRIKEQTGIVQMDEPALSLPLSSSLTEEEKKEKEPEKTEKTPEKEIKEEEKKKKETDKKEKEEEK